MNRNAINNTLKKHQVRPTLIREQVLQLLTEKKYALSHSDIENILNEKSDRVTIYRTLNTFVDNGIIHKIFDQNGVTKFALCHDECGPSNHIDQHFHFQCKYCQHVYCLDDIALPKIFFPKNFTILELQLKAEGICPDCQTRKENHEA